MTKLLTLTIGLSFFSAGATANRVQNLASGTVLVFQTDTSHRSIEFQCSGSLIAYDLVLTAAHCLFPLGKGNQKQVDAKNIMIYFGDLHFGEAFAARRVVYASKAVTHPAYSGRFSKEEMPNLKDLAIIKLGKRAPRWSSPVKVLPTSVSLSKGLSVLVAGYGKSYEGQQHQDLIFHRYNGYSIGNAGQDYSLVTLNGLPLSGSKEGDSGGPSFIDMNGSFRQWGVFSAYDPNAGLAFYVDLRKEKTWLNETAKTLDSDFSVE